MPVKGTRRNPYPASRHEPNGIWFWMTKYVEWLRVRNFSERTIINREKYIERFLHWSEARNLTRPMDVTKPVLDRYQRHLFHLRKSDGKPLTFRAQESHLVALRAYFKWLTKQNILLSNPASEIELPRQAKTLPRDVLTADEVELVMAQPDTDSVFGLRDRTMLEVLFSTGMRRGELVRMRLHDVDVARDTVLVRGKGNKERTVPIGQRALLWLDKYQLTARPKLLTLPDDGAMFLTHFGHAFAAESLTAVIRRHVEAAELGKLGSCHLFRHTAATLMLEGGADIRYIQEMLGHVELGTTQIYTRVSIRQLKAVHERTHPSARIDWGVRKARPRDEQEQMADEQTVTGDEGTAAQCTSRQVMGRCC
jgi:integrase/recombinase XerD